MVLKSFCKRFFEYFNKLSSNKRTSLLICTLSGLVGALPYFIEELFLLTFVSLFVLFFVIIKRSENSSGAFFPFFVFFLGFYIPLYSFLAELYPYDRFGFDESQAFFILICSCLLIPLAHASLSALIMMTSKLFPKNGFEIIGYASLWVVTEFILSIGILAFPWGCISVSMTGFLPYLQTASLFGKYFITFVTVASCFSFALAATRKIKLFALIGAIIIGFNSIIGTVIYFIPTQKNEAISVAAVQGNALADEKWALKNRKTIFERYIKMAREAAENGAEIILLPESAFPQSFSKNDILHTSLAEISTEFDVTIISGVRYVDFEKDYIEEFNSCIAILPDGGLSNRYDKRHLVPFGEFIPFAETLGELLPFVGEFNESSSTFIEGTEPIIIDTNHGKIAPLVCFDSIFPSFAREGVKNGATSIAVVTNDSWFFDSVGVYTHLRHSQIRAIENGRYVSRAANTGISAFINEKGRILECSEPLVQDIIYSTVYNIESNTLYSIIGDVIVYFSFAIIIILFIFGTFRKNKV